MRTTVRRGYVTIMEREHTAQRIAERRILFAPLADALAALKLDGPVALLGTPRSLAAVPDDAFGDAVVLRYDGVRPHNPRAVVDEAGAFVDAHRCATVVAIGSSSAIDLGKAVSDGR
ncbi:MAG: iron-containing alcohol dehydrogenase, partial [Candidatus Eremiobacteraeota bacterium]|nr:iron-containing alcohol dehydrogenase [Candidatus Eremiobacteraeota bacterium]